MKVQSIPVFHSASVGRWSGDHSAPPIKAINLDHSLNYLLTSANNNVEPPEQPSSSTSSSSLISSLHTTDLTQQNHPPSSVVGNSIPQPHLHIVSHSPAACSDTVTQAVKVAHIAVQTDHGNVPVVPSISSQSVTAMSSSEFDNKMEHMMTTALLNAKDTVNTIEAISQSLLMKSVSRESSLMSIPLQHQLTSTQCVANNQGVAYSQDVINTPRMTTIQELANSHNSQNGNLMDSRTHITPSGHTPRSHADHVITSQQHSYTLYNTGHHEDTSLYLNRWGISLIF